MAQREGYLLIDHRASPGVPEEIALAVGYDPKLVREGKVLEEATLTCKHCKGTVRKNRFRIRARHSCMKCSGHYICDWCYFESLLPDYDHLPYEKKVEIVTAGKGRLWDKLHPSQPLTCISTQQKGDNHG